MQKNRNDNKKKYRGLDDFSHALKYVDDEDIENAVKSGEPLRTEIIMAMGQTYDEKYLPNLYKALYDENHVRRQDARLSIMTINGKKGFAELKKNWLSLEDPDGTSSEKAVCEAIIMRIEKGVDYMLAQLLSDDTRDALKFCIAAYNGWGYRLDSDDIRLRHGVIRAIIDKSIKWHEKPDSLDVRDWLESCYDDLGFSAVEYPSALSEISDGLSADIVQMVKDTVERRRASTEIKRMMAKMTTGMRREYALEILSFLKGRVCGCAKSEFRRALKFFKITEDDLI